MKVCTQNQGLTIWFTGLSGSGKSTLSQALKSFLEDECQRKTIILDGDKIRKGINSGLGFSQEDRAQNIRRVSQMAKLMNQEGMISIVACISPYEKDRQNARKIHQENNLRFYEFYVDCQLQICEKRDPKGLYKKARSGQLKQFTGVSDCYESPKKAQLVLRTGQESMDESFQKMLCFISKNYLMKEYSSSQKYLYIDYECDIDDLNLLQVFLQKWTQVDNFMNYRQLLESLYFKTYTKGKQTFFQPIPLFTLVKKQFVQNVNNIKNFKIRFINKINQSVVAVLQNPKFEYFRFQEFCCKIFGVYSKNHPKIQQLLNKGEYILSGSKLIFKCLKIFFNDGLDYLRKNTSQIKQQIIKFESDCIYAFQLRNPLHNGHLFLLQNAKKMLIQKGFKKPVLLLHPCGGWVKQDDVPLSVRVQQHEQLMANNEIFKNSQFMLAIWPSPMYYAGPLEVLWHIKSREMIGINYMVVGRDPAGIKHPEDIQRDLYDPFDGQKIIEIAKSLGFIKTEIIPFKVVAWNKIQKKLMELNDQKKEQFENISGSQMRKMAKNNEMVPSWFMNKQSWKVLSAYYSKISQ